MSLWEEYRRKKHKCESLVALTKAKAGSHSTKSLVHCSFPFLGSPLLDCGKRQVVGFHHRIYQCRFWWFP